jgi:hypothetical protein
VSRDYFASGFFHGSSSLKPPKITLGSFRILLKILGAIYKSRCTTGVNGILPLQSTTPAANFATGTAGVVDTGGK